MCVVCSGVKKEAFLGFFDYYQNTAVRLAAMLDDQTMLVSAVSGQCDVSAVSGQCDVSGE